MTPYLRVATILVSVTLLAGCSSMRKPGFPRQSYNEKAQIKALEAVFEKPTLISDYYALCAREGVTEAQKSAARNHIIDGRLALINLNYNNFVAEFASTKQTIDFTAEMAELGVNLATTAAGGESAKTVLGAVSAGITGTKLAVDKNFFFEKTVPVLVSSMNAQRKEMLAPILKGMKRSADDYPLTQALSDLDAYYFAGTFLGALQTIQAEAGSKEKEAQKTINFIRDPGYASDAVQMRVDALANSIQKLSDAQVIELEKQPPVKDAAIEAVVSARDPNNRRANDPSVARQILKMRIIMGSERDEKTLTTWEAAIKSLK